MKHRTPSTSALNYMERFVCEKTNQEGFDVPTTATARICLAGVIWCAGYAAFFSIKD